MTEKIVLSLGGSLLYEEGEFNAQKAMEITALLAKQKNLGVVVGGGAKARHYAEKTRAETHNEFEADLSAINATHENAQAIVRENKKMVFCKDFDEAAKAFEAKKIPVMGGMLPGITTDAVAVLLAEKLGAKTLVNASKVNGIYDKKPWENGAKLLEKLSYGKLMKFANKFDERKAGTNFVFDVVASKLACRSRIKIVFVDGRDLKELENALEGRKTSGTVVE